MGSMNKSGRHRTRYLWARADGERHMSTLALVLSAFMAVGASAATQDITIPADVIASTLNGVLSSAKLRLSNIDDTYDEENGSFYVADDAYIRILGKREPIDLFDAYITWRRENGKTRYHYGIRNLESEVIAVQRRSGEYQLLIVMESDGHEVKGLCRYKKRGGHYTQCRPSGNDKPAPDANFDNAKVRLTLAPSVSGGRVHVRVRRPEDIRMAGDLRVNGVIGWFDRIEEMVEERMVDRVRTVLHGYLNDDDVQEMLSSAIEVGLSRANALSPHVQFTPLRFAPNGDLIVRVETPSLVGVWRELQGDEAIRRASTWSEFQEQRKQLADTQMLLVDVEVMKTGTKLEYVGAWRKGEGADRLYKGTRWDELARKWRDLGERGFYLRDLEIYKANGKTHYIGVWGPGEGKAALFALGSWQEFVGKWRDLSAQGLRLVDVEVRGAGKHASFAGVWRQGGGKHGLYRYSSWSSLVESVKANATEGRHLLDVEVYRSNGRNQFIAVFGKRSRRYALRRFDDWSDFIKEARAKRLNNLKLATSRSTNSRLRRRVLGPVARCIGDTPAFVLAGLRATAIARERSATVSRSLRWAVQRPKIAF